MEGVDGSEWRLRRSQRMSLSLRHYIQMKGGAVSRQCAWDPGEKRKVVQGGGESRLEQGVRCVLPVTDTLRMSGIFAAVCDCTLQSTRDVHDCKKMNYLADCQDSQLCLVH